MVKRMSVLFVSLLLTGTAFSQPKSPDLSTIAACGNAKTSFHVRFTGDGSGSNSGLSNEQAKLYIFEQYIQNDRGHFGRPIVRQGLDGTWIGATQGLSYVETNVEPGLHHLCSQMQSHNRKLSSLISLNSVTVEAKRPYYFRSQVHSDSALLELVPISEDEGKRLLSQADKAVSEAK